MVTLAVVWETLVHGLMAVLKKLRNRNRTTPSSLQINVSGDHNAINVVLPGTGRDIARASSSETSRTADLPAVDRPVAPSGRVASERAQSTKR